MNIIAKLDSDVVLTDDRGMIDLDCVYEWIATSYWSKGIPREIFDKSLQNSMVFGLLRAQTTIGFSRFVTDRATFAYLCDVFIDPGERGAGLGKWMTHRILEQPDIAGLRRIMLATASAHAVYRAAGFKPLSAPQKFMEIHRPDIYERA